ncbi:MAG: hypothetical protein XD97_0505 [Pelotomaculum thermopropionicum]|uniref:UPF0251 protein XD97_0505 n=1 Tax=Pelotomaculum thermopropionicum TaxID=110500 RepID=A0A124FYS6_9FIRM|nr:MAG: hypothetical protein XD97_0505 [Pelotomaculum thermopropionicum]
MPRPPKCRRVEQFPGFTYFKPSGIPVTRLKEVVLSIEELEAVRLRDLSGMEHEDCAQKMSVSRPTFHRILASARQKIAEALVNGAALRIAGGNFKLAEYDLNCRKCGHNWRGTINFRRTLCPACSGRDWQRMELKSKPIYRGGAEVKIAMPYLKGKVNPHFGNSREFVIIEVEDGKIKGQNILSNENLHDHGGLAHLLKTEGVNVIITGGMGRPMANALYHEGFNVITGASGEVEEVAQEFLAGRLASGPTGCGCGCGGPHEHPHG